MVPDRIMVVGISSDNLAAVMCSSPLCHLTAIVSHFPFQEQLHYPVVKIKVWKHKGTGIHIFRFSK